MDNDPKLNLIFLVGALRSGTTVLRLMLDHHPEISNPGEYDFFFDEVSDDGIVPDADVFMEWLETERVYQYSGLSYDPELDYVSNLKSFFKVLSKNKTNVVINIHRNFHKIPMLFPEARFIHLLRDPRDVARSSIGMGWSGNVYYGVDHWIGSENSWGRFASDLDNDKYTEVTFESLIDKTDETLQELCDFIGVLFSKKMYDYQNNSTYSAPDKTLIWQWKRKLSPQEIMQVESKAGGLMINRGYQPVNDGEITLGLLTRARLYIQNKLVRWKFSMARVGVWLFFVEKITRKLGLNKLNSKYRKKIQTIQQALVK